MSEFRICQVTKNKIDIIQGMVAPEVVDAIKHDLPATVLAVVDGDEAVGALGGAVDEDIFEIVSIFVAPERRREGAGTALMKQLFEFLDAEDLMVRARYTPVSEEEKTLAPFFRSLDFTQEDLCLPLYCVIPVEQIRVDGRSLSGSMSRIGSFKETPVKLLSEYGLNKADIVKDTEGDVIVNEDVDEEMSFTSTKNNRISSCLLTDRYKADMVRLTPYWFEDPDTYDVRDMKLMLSYALDEIRRKYTPKQSVVVTIMDRASRDIADEFFGARAAVTVSFIKSRYEEI